MRKRLLCTCVILSFVIMLFYCSSFYKSSGGDTIFDGPSVGDDIQEVYQQYGDSEVTGFFHGLFCTFGIEGRYHVIRSNGTEVTGVAVFSESKEFLSAGGIKPVSARKIEKYLGKSQQNVERHLGDPHVIFGAYFSPAYLTKNGHFLWLEYSRKEPNVVSAIYMQDVITGTTKFIAEGDTEWTQIGY